MKPITFLPRTLFFVLLLSSYYGECQKVRLGLSVIPSMTTAHNPQGAAATGDKYLLRTSFNFGTQFIFDIKDSTFFIESGIYIVDRGDLVKGVKIDHNSSNGGFITVSDRYSHHYYLSIPILFRTEFHNFYFSTGPSIDYYLKSKYVLTPEEDLTIKLDYSKSFIEDISLGFDLNFGYQIRFGKRTSFSIEASFHPSNFSQNSIDNKWIYYLNYGLGFGFQIGI